MPLNTKTIKRRIKSIGSTKKITRAMEMISAVKMRKAVAAVLASRAYAKLAWEVLFDIAGKTDIKHHPLLARRAVKKIGLIFITSNRGLAGGFTSRLLAEAHQYLQKEEASADIILMGRRGQRLYTRFNHNIASEFEKIDLTASIAEILPLTQTVVNDYVNGKYDKIALAYMDFVSAVKQVPRIKQLLPIPLHFELLFSTDVPLAAGFDVSLRGEERRSNLNNAPGDNQIASVARPRLPAGDYGGLPRNDRYGYGFKYEPNVKQVLDNLLPRLIEMQIYQAVLESDASEHSARMLAMKNASEAAEDITRELQFNYNKARQAAITQEIAEVVGGAAALE